METNERKFYTTGYISFVGYVDSKQDPQILLGLLKGAVHDCPWKSKNEQGILVDCPLECKHKDEKRNGIHTFSLQTTRPFTHDEVQLYPHSPWLTVSQLNAFCNHISSLVKYLESYKLEETQHIDHSVEFSWAGRIVLTPVGKENHMAMFQGNTVPHVDRP